MFKSLTKTTLSQVRNSHDSTVMLKYGKKKKVFAPLGDLFSFSGEPVDKDVISKFLKNERV
jgi:hypothetical protein